jgi:uncharacterized membrane-anchored protein YhcB (DUF1043 family)
VAEEKARETAQALGNATNASWGLAESATQDFLQGTAAIGTQLQQLPNDLVDKLFPECPTAMFIVPTGTRQEDYSIVYDLDDVFENLKSGIFVRPKLEAWAATDSRWDPAQLGERIKSEFLLQFEERRSKLVESGEVDVRKLEAQLQRQSEEMSGQFDQGASSLTKAPVYFGIAGLLLNPVTWPLSLVFLGLGLRNGTNVVRMTGRYFGAMSNKLETNRELRQRQKDLEEIEKEFDVKNEAFLKLISNLAILPHPQLHKLYRLICEKDKVSPHYIYPGTTSANVPDVRPYLKGHAFQGKNERRYRGLIEAL